MHDKGQKIKDSELGADCTSLKIYNALGLSLTMEANYIAQPGLLTSKRIATGAFCTTPA